MSGQSAPGAAALADGVNPVRWGSQDFFSSSVSPLSPPVSLVLSPATSSTTQDSRKSNTPPVQALLSTSADGSAPGNQKNGQRKNHQKSQKELNTNQARISIPVACVPCRSRHLKCDGGMQCSRCKADAVECTYIKSRRGWKGKHKSKEGKVASDALHDLRTSDVPLMSTNLSSTNNAYSYSNLPVPSQLGLAHGFGSGRHAPSLPQLKFDGTPVLDRFGRAGPETAVQAFFHFFFHSHPFCLPEPRLIELFNEREAPLLELAVQFIGSSFVPAMSTEIYKEALNRHINNGNYTRDVWSVQALMLFAIGLHAHNEVPRAAQIFTMAQSLTLELGLHRSEFVAVHGGNDSQLQECIRRTWWSMFTVNGMMTAVNPGVQFRLKDVVTDVPLPCENVQYFSDQIPYPNTLQEYDDSAFLPTLAVFSSFAYLIDAVRILGKIFECARLDSAFEYHAVDVVDQYLCNWRLHLPASKLDIVSNDGHVDEVLFQAHMVNAGSTIMLHRPRSNLGFGAVEGVNLCVQPGQALLPTQTREIHTAKCQMSAENISSLIRLPVQLLHHTPFFTCVVVMASVVHLSYWSFLVPDGQDDIIKQSIRLDVGTLQHYSNTWPIANVVLGQVRGVAHTLFNSKKAMSIHLWSNLDSHDIIRNVIEEGGNVPIQTYAQLIAPMLKS